MVKILFAAMLLLNMTTMLWAADLTHKKEPSSKIQMNATKSADNLQKLPKCTGGQAWNNDAKKCECRANVYWNDAKQLCRPVRTCAPDKVFDREKDDC
ncbi:MAG: hypothetical protein JXR79_02550, partial [Nitrospirae bacterium]|nr:hypothetical protein [Nitrospirota bacterium]